MDEKINIAPFDKELPSEYADRLGVYYTKQVTQKHKKDKGQFFTPTPIARLMASFCELTKSSLKILDPGCGTAVLSSALVEHLTELNPNIKLIELVAYETDLELISFSQKTLSYLKKW